LLVCAAQLNVSAIGLRAADLRAMTLDFLMMRTICVYCGSSPGERPEFLAAARHVGELIGRGGHRLVYGGGNVGLMGAVADAAMLHGAKAIGVIPQRLVADISHLALPSYAAEWYSVMITVSPRLRLPHFRFFRS
jgi:predicted Rossmann-fold nucleotide-binding protein